MSTIEKALAKQQQTNKNVSNGVDDEITELSSSTKGQADKLTNAEEKAEKENLEAITSTIDEHLESLHSLGKKMTAAVLKEIDLETSLVSLRDQFQSITHRLSQAQDNYEDMLKKCNRENAKLKCLKKKLDGKTSTIARLKTSLQEMSLLREEVCCQKSQLELKVVQARKDLNKTREALKEVKDTQSSLEALNGVLSVEFENTQIKIQKLKVLIIF